VALSISFRRVSVSSLGGLVARPVAVAAGVAALLAILTDAGSHPLALVTFTFAAFSLAALAQEFWRGASAQRTLAGGSLPQALATLVGRNRRRYGGYVVHAGLAVLLIAVAASSSFQTSRDLRLRPGQSAAVGGYTVRYLKPTSQIVPSENRLTLGAVLAVSKDGRPWATLTPSRNYYAASTVAPQTGPIRSFFEGEATSEVGRRTEPAGDVWTAMQPELGPLNGKINGADRILLGIRRSLSQGDPAAAAKYARAQGAAIAAIAAYYLQHTPPADFRVNVNPLVIWIWLGGAISLAGALIAIWPAPEARRRRVSDVYAARLARELGGA